MKTLYISDLDGTLLGEKAVLSDYSKRELNRLIAQGMDFTIATARSIVTVETILNGLNIRLPLILLNGSAIYDMKTKKYLSIENIDSQTIAIIMSLTDMFNISGFFFEIKDSKHITHYDRAETDYVKNYVVERRRTYGEDCVLHTPFKQLVDKNIVYFSVCSTYETLKHFYDEIKKLTSVNIEFYKDTYIKDGYFLEIASKNASKRNGLIKMKNLYNFEKIVAFGDNLNDLPMFDVSDESYAVEGANEIVKHKATAVIGANTDDAVVKWLINTEKKL